MVVEDIMSSLSLNLSPLYIYIYIYPPAPFVTTALIIYYNSPSLGASVATNTVFNLNFVSKSFICLAAFLSDGKCLP